MFKCKECGCEYDVKPDYCDCGNDTFEEIEIKITETQKPEPIEPVKKTQEIQINQQRTYAPQDNIKKSFNEQYPEFDRLKKSLDPISLTVLILCLATSFFVLFFVGNPKEDSEKPDIVQAETETQSIPSIDTFWNNSTSGIINNEKSAAQQVSQSVKQQVSQTPNPIQPLVQSTQDTQQLQPQAAKSIQQAKQQTQNQSAKSQQTQQSAKTSVQNISPISKIFGNNKPSQTNTNAPKQNNQPQQTPPKQQSNTAPKIPAATQNIANQPQPTAGTVNKSVQTSNNATPQPSKSNTSTSATTNNNTSPQQNTQKTKTTVNIPSNNTLRPQANIDTQALKRELDNYKVGLRNTIGRKVDFTKVVGDGECVVAFKIASNGKLINRSFAKQSSNITLNDAVYSAIMATPSYNPPPSGYNNETLNLKIRFYGGNYDVSLY